MSMYYIGIIVSTMGISNQNEIINWKENEQFNISYAAFQTYENYFLEAPLLVERAVDQPSLIDTNIPKWFATKDWNFLLSNLDDAYENLVKEFYANVIVEGEELKC